MRRLLTVAIAAVTAMVAWAGPAGANTGTPVTASANELTLAVIGDTPYGVAQLEQFPALIADINADPKVDLALHVGDIKSGSTQCTGAYFATINSLFGTFKDPLVYTPGDNEWTDCHRVNNGAYDPLERLAALRAAFFPDPGVTLGGRMKHVLTQPSYPENQLWLQSRVAFSAVHVVGSQNNLAPWTNETPAQREARVAEANARIAAAVQWIDATFALAQAEDAEGVVLAMQADTFFLANETSPGFAAIVSRLEQRAAEFARPVLLIQGDTHDYLVDAPLAGAPNLTRVVVEGETASEWLRLTVNPRIPQVFSWERVAL
jgi:Calcineurin-like phosphoesterase